MNEYQSMTGIVSQILPAGKSENDKGCALSLTLQTYYQGTVSFTFTGNTYVLDSETILPGDQLTVFFDRNAPTVLIYPPVYQAVLLAKPSGHQFYLGDFDEQNLSSDGALQLILDQNTKILLPNGQFFSGSFAGKTVLAEYQNSTRSIPPQAIAERIIVFC